MKRVLLCFVIIILSIALVACNNFYQKEVNYPKPKPTQANCSEGIHAWDNLISYFTPDEGKSFHCSLCDTELSFEDYTDENFISLIKESYLKSVHDEFYFIDGKEYGRVISSSDSRENAIEICTNRFTDNRYEGYENSVLSCEVIYESELFYGLNVKWATKNSTYEENVISFKKDIADISVYSVITGEENSFNILTNNETDIYTIALYLYQNQWEFKTLLDFTCTSNDKEYRIDVYTYIPVYGDWNLDDEHNFYKETIIIDKETGSVAFDEPELIKQICVEGSLSYE